MARADQGRIIAGFVAYRIRSYAACSKEDERSSNAGKERRYADGVRRAREGQTKEKSAALDAAGAAAALALLRTEREATHTGSAGQRSEEKATAAQTGAAGDVAPTRRVSRLKPSATPLANGVRRSTTQRWGVALQEAPPSGGVAPQAGSATSALVDMFSTLRQELRQGLPEFQGRTDVWLDQVQRVVRSATEPLAARQLAMEGQLNAREKANSWRT